MSTVVHASDISKRYRDTTALDNVGFRLEENTITGLLGRNGAGKTTLMQILAGQEFADSGSAEVFGEAPAENDRVLRDVCFIKESQKYPDHFKVHHVLRSARMLYPNWDEDYARELVEDFALPPRKHVKRLSRGMLSALGVIIGLASRAPLTFFDEPYLGLDAVARQMFYDRLLADYAENPRTVVLSTHLIDEASDLIEHVVVIDRGQVLFDEDADDLRGGAVTVSGPAAEVEAFTGVCDRLRVERLGNTARVTVRGTFSPSDQTDAKARGLELEPVSLQQLIVHSTTPTQPGGQYGDVQEVSS